MAFSVPDVEAITPALKPIKRGQSRYILIPKDWPVTGDLRLILLEERD